MVFQTASNTSLDKSVVRSLWSRRITLPKRPSVLVAAREIFFSNLLGSIIFSTSVIPECLCRESILDPRLKHSGVTMLYSYFFQNFIIINLLDLFVAQNPFQIAMALRGHHHIIWHRHNPGQTVHPDNIT